jgi:hypothetical protein
MENKSFVVYIQHRSTLLTLFQFIATMEMCYIVSFLISVIGVISNIINIKVFVAMGLHDGVTVSFLGLAIFDLAYLLSSLSLSVSTAFYIYELKTHATFYLDPYAILVYSATIMIILSISNILTTTFLAVVRCLCVAKPLQFKDTVTTERAVLIIIGIVIFSVTVYIPILANTGMANKFDQKRNMSRLTLWFSPKRDIVKNNVLMIIEMFLPISTQLIILLCIVVMIRCLRAASKFRQSSLSVITLVDKKNNKNNSHQQSKESAEDSANISSTKLTGKDLRVVQQVFLISLVYIVCNTPKIFITFFSWFEPEFALGKAYTDIYVLVHCTRKIFEIINATVNFIIYYKYNTNFRSILSLQSP